MTDAKSFEEKRDEAAEKHATVETTLYDFGGERIGDGFQVCSVTSANFTAGANWCRELFEEKMRDSRCLLTESQLNVLLDNTAKLAAAEAEIASLKKWKAEQIEVTKPIFEFEHPELKLGMRRISFILSLANERDSAFAAIRGLAEVVDTSHTHLDYHFNYIPPEKCASCISLKEFATIISKARGVE